MKYACHFYSGIILLLIWIICVDFWFGQLSTKKTFTFSATFFQGVAIPRMSIFCSVFRHPKTSLYALKHLGFLVWIFATSKPLDCYPNYPRYFCSVDRGQPQAQGAKI